MGRVEQPSLLHFVFSELQSLPKSIQWHRVAKSRRIMAATRLFAMKETHTYNEVLKRNRTQYLFLELEEKTKDVHQMS